MSFVRNFLLSTLFYLSFFCLFALCRISDKRKCANADCSEPISLATTLIRYNADDDRLLSFPRNVKLTVFSKEAGDNPNFWEVEVRGKRGYVPKGLLKEEKVLVPSSKLTHIVPTGRTDSPKPNTTNTKSEEIETNPYAKLAATPKLPAANSKGLFSTIGGVSADSVPLNSPDIKPQTTRKFQVFDGTTIYEDVVTEKPESPPTVIEDNVDGKQESDEKPSSMKQMPHDSNDPSSEMKPVHEHIDENNEVIGKKESVKEADRVTEKEEHMNKKSDYKEGQPQEGAIEPPDESNFFNNMFNKVTDSVSKIMSSGAGESIEDELEEDEGEEDFGEEEDYTDDEEDDIETDDKFSETAKTYPVDQPKSGVKSSELISSDMPEAITLVDKLDNSSSFKRLDDSSNKSHDEIDQYKEVLGDKSIYRNDKVTDEFIKDTSNMKIESDATDQYNQFNISGKEVEMLSKPSGPVSEDESKIVRPQVFETYGDGLKEKEKQISDESQLNEQLISESLYYKENPKTDESLVQDQLKDGESQVEQQSKTDEPLIEEQARNDEPQVQEHSEHNTIEAQKQPKSDELQVQEEPSTDKFQPQEQTKTEPQVEPKIEDSVQGKLKTEDPQVQEQLKIDESQIKEQPKTEDPQSKEKLKTEESQIQEQHIIQEPKLQEEIKTDKPQTDDYPKIEGSQKQEYPEVTTKSPVSEPTTGQSTESQNYTSEDKLSFPHPIYSSISKVPIESPKYSSVINRRIQSSDSSPVSDNLSDPSEDTDGESFESLEGPNSIETSGSQLTNEDTLSSNILFPSQSPKYSAVVNNRIGPVKSYNDVSETIHEKTIDSQEKYTESLISKTDETVPDINEVETINNEDVKQIDVLVDVNDVSPDDSQAKPVGDLSPSQSIVDTPGEEEGITEEGILSWAASFFDVFRSKDSGSGEETSGILENSDTVSSHLSHFEEETCSADGVEGSCPTLSETMHNEVTWQEASYTSDLWLLLEKVPLEATIWLIVTAIVVLIFSLGHYYIEAHRRDGPLVAIINKLERELLILRKEKCIMEDRLNIAEQQLDAWNTSSSENDALLVELKQELEEIKAAKAELEEQTTQLKEELETVTESGLEMHRLLEESLSSQDGSQVLLTTVETLREKLQRQEEEISGLSDTLSSKNAEVEELQGSLSQAAEVARSLEDRVIAVTREKEEELLRLRDQHRGLISQLEENAGRGEVMETKALEETRLSTEMSKLRLTIEELQKILAEKDSELDTLKEVVKQLRSTDSNEKMEALFDVVSVQAKLKTAVIERDDLREKFMEEEGARKLLEGHMKKITQEVAELKNSFETAEKEKIEALTKLQVLSNYFKEKESQLQKELGLQESMWLQKQSDDHTIYEQMRSLREENEKYKLTKGEAQSNGGVPKPMPNLAEVKTKKKSNPKLGSVRQAQGLQNESLKKEIVEQEASFKIQLANTEQKAHENWVASRQTERRLKEAQQEAAQLRNRLTTVEKNSANYSLDEKPNISESNGDPSSPPPSLMFPPTTSPPFMMYGPPIPPPGDFVPPPPLMGSPYPSDSRPPPLGRISSPPLDHRFSPPPPLPYPPYDYSPYGHHSPSPPPPMPPHHRNVHKPQPREMSREQKDHVPSYSPEGEKNSRRNKR